MVIEHEGEKMPISAWVERLGIKKVTLVARLLRKVPLEKALRPGRLNAHG